MSSSTYTLVVVSDEPLTLDALARGAGLHPAVVERFVEFGLLHPIGRRDTVLLFEASALPRLRKIRRLRDSLGINLAGISVILDLLDRLHAARRSR